MQNVQVMFGDGIAYLNENCLKMPSHAVAYIDPPYVANGYKLYRYHFNKEQHEQLAEAVSVLRVPWLISYDNHELIRNLYTGEQAKYVKTYQSLRSSRFVKEILLLSEDFMLPSGASPEARPRGRRGHAELLDFDNQ